MPKRQFQGTVVSSKCDKTIVVAVERMEKHPIYKKFVRRTCKFVAHDEQNTCQPGDLVSIEESRPYSRMKRWKLLEIITNS